MKYMTMLLCAGMMFGGMVALSAATPLEIAEGLQDAFADVTEKATPAVVIVTAKKRPEYRIPLELLMMYRHFGYNIRANPQNSEPVPSGKGSGFFIRDDGYIVTNCHVINGADEVSVSLRDGRELKATVIGEDVQTDIALLKIEGEGYPVLAFGNSDSVRVGHWAIAIGAPHNLDYTMTVGAVSQKGRAVGMNIYENYIQTDASINPGNSGGPLLNIRGELIGVNDFIVSGSGGNIGLGFAIPSNMVRSVVNQLISHGTVVRAYVGITPRALTAKALKELKLPEETQGVMVWRPLYRGTPAANAGIRLGDIITHMGGKPVKNENDFKMLLLSYLPGDDVSVTVLRDGKELKFDIKSYGEDTKSQIIKPTPELRKLIQSGSFEKR